MEVFKRCLDLALGDVFLCFRGYSGSTGLMDLMILKVSSNFDNSMILTCNNNGNFSNCNGKKTQ